MDYKKISLERHYEWNGKIEIASRVRINTQEDLSLAYTPGVAEPCMEIYNNYEKSFDLTRRGNLVADDELNEEYIIPNALDRRVSKAVAKSVIEVANETKVARV